MYCPLWLFKKTRFVTHSDVLSVIRLSDDDFKAMMTPLANKTNRGWEFKFPTDEEFLENHPAIQRSQDMKWNCRYKQLVQDLKMSQTEVNSMMQQPKKAKASCAYLSFRDLRCWGACADVSVK
ncbi:hypothetical protein TNCV_2678531 [Trichonephila clavipes]|nr:hypothetical protein TNCV_2678531 [Trichonephila clavipes]